jgi:hypothetical protein
MNTTSAPSYGKCSYCGNFHSYSAEMCRDSIKNMTALNNLLPSSDEISLRLENQSLKNQITDLQSQNKELQDKLNERN